MKNTGHRNFRRLIFDGDSLSYQFLHAYAMETYNSVNTTQNPLCYYNFAVPGMTADYLVSNFSAHTLGSIRENDVVVIWIGTNDLAAVGVYGGAFGAAATYQKIQDYCGLVKALGGKVIVGTIIARSILGSDPLTMDTQRQTVNTNIRNNWQNFADGMIDFGGTTHLSILTDPLNTTYYGVDQVHLTTSAGYPLAASVAIPVINTVLQA